MVRISVDDLVTPDVGHVKHEDLLGQQIDESLNALGHLLWLLRVLSLVQQTGEVKGWVSHLEAADVELVLEEHLIVVDLLLLAEVVPDLIANGEYGLYHLLLIELVLFFARSLLIVETVVGIFSARILRVVELH